MPLLIGNSSTPNFYSPSTPNFYAADGGNTVVHLSKYGDVFTSGRMDITSPVSDEGTYYKVFSYSGTAFAPIAASNQTGFVATAPFFAFSVPDLNGSRVFIDYIRLMCTTVSSAVAAIGATLNVAIVVDQNRTLSAFGTQYIPFSSNNSYARNDSYLQVNAGALTVSAASPHARTIGRHILKTHNSATSASMCVLGDLYSIDFGEHSQSTSTTGTTAPPAPATAYSCSSGPACLGPGDMLCFYLWGTTTFGTPAFDFEIGWWER
jgi:hypothetical protein